MPHLPRLLTLILTLTACSIPSSDGPSEDENSSDTSGTSIGETSTDGLASTTSMSTTSDESTTGLDGTSEDTNEDPLEPPVVFDVGFLEPSGDTGTTSGADEDSGGLPVCPDPPWEGGDWCRLPSGQTTQCPTFCVIHPSGLMTCGDVTCECGTTGLWHCT